MYSTVRQIIASKGDAIYSVKPTDTLEIALKLMDEKEVGALLVMEDNNIVGIFSERDFARKVLVQGLAKPTTKISQMMSPEVLCISPDRSMPDCMNLMTNKRIRHLPVIENDKVMGIVSIGDIVNRVIMDQKTDITVLEDYITGGYGKRVV
ncbi:CBS domain-containing protein [bacterium]|nr:CBS domain-containing protein [bacterium]MBU1917478.1 CBS domain-containing protein [bacterium]